MKLVKSMDFLDKDKYLSKAIMSSAPQKSEWTLNGLKLVYLVASMISDYRYFVDKKSNINSLSDDSIKSHLKKVPRNYEISRSDFVELTGISTSHAAREIKNACQDVLLKLMTTPNPFDLKNKNSFEMNQWFSKAKYNDTKGVIEIIVHEDALPYFVVLVDYTRLNYSYIGSLKNTYSVRTYLICKVIQNKYTPSININFDIEEFKTKIGLKGKYKNVPLFRERVLDVIKNEINTKTDIVFDYSLEKIGRSFKNIEIKIYQKGKNTLITSGLEYKSFDKSSKKIDTHNIMDDIDIENELDDEKVKIASKLKQFGIKDTKANELLTLYGSDYVELGIESLINEINKGVYIKNTAGYLLKCIENISNEKDSIDIHTEQAEKIIRDNLDKERLNKRFKDFDDLMLEKEQDILLLLIKHDKKEKLHHHDEIEALIKIRSIVDDYKDLKNCNKELSISATINGLSIVIYYSTLNQVLNDLKIATKPQRIKKYKELIEEARKDLKNANYQYKVLLEKQISELSIKIANLV